LDPFGNLAPWWYADSPEPSVQKLEPLFDEDARGEGEAPGEFAESRELTFCNP
jgi:hypothetical protein